MASIVFVQVGDIKVQALYVRGSTPWQREDGGSSELWAIPLEDVCEGLEKRPSEVRSMQDLDVELGFGGCDYYQGPGRAFSRGAYVRVTRSRVVVTIRHDLDI